MCRMALLLGAWLLLAAAIHAEDPKCELLPMPKPAEGMLPAPRVLDEMGPLGPVLPGFFLPDPYAHWEYLAVDKQGYLKPRVILAPQPYYLYNGKPYLFLPTRPEDMSTSPGWTRRTPSGSSSTRT